MVGLHRGSRPWRSSSAQALQVTPDVKGAGDRRPESPSAMPRRQLGCRVSPELASRARVNSSRSPHRWARTGACEGRVGRRPPRGTPAHIRRHRAGNRNAQRTPLRTNRRAHGTQTPATALLNQAGVAVPHGHRSNQSPGRAAPGARGGATPADVETGMRGRAPTPGNLGWALQPRGVLTGTADLAAVSAHPPARWTWLWHAHPPGRRAPGPGGSHPGEAMPRRERSSDRAATGQRMATSRACHPDR